MGGNGTGQLGGATGSVKVAGNGHGTSNHLVGSLAGSRTLRRA
jgi:hypothetical protein